MLRRLAVAGVPQVPAEVAVVAEVAGVAVVAGAVALLLRVAAAVVVVPLALEEADLLG